MQPRVAAKRTREMKIVQAGEALMVSLLLSCPGFSADGSDPPPGASPPRPVQQVLH